MNKIYSILSAFALLFGLSNTANSQCAQIVASPASASCNVSYNFNVTGNLFGTTFDFNSGVLPAGWDASPYTVGTPCQTNMPDNSPYFWATTLKSGVRYVRTNPLNVSNGGDIEFFMRYGSDDPGNGCEDPDLTVEGVYLQFSTNGGSSWQTINNWTPLSNYVGPLYHWNKYSITIPVAAQTANTIFRWFQPRNSGDMWDNWGLDNIEVAAVSGATFAWDFGDGSTSSAQNPSHSYAAAGTYTVTLAVTSQNCNTTVSTQVTVAPGPSLVANITQPSCPSNSDGEIETEFQNATLPVSYSWTPSSAGTNNTISNLSEGVYELFVTDANGCNASATYELASQGSIAPVAIAKDATVLLDASGSASISASDIDNGSYSDCGSIATIEIDQSSFDCSDIGNNIVTLIVTDSYGNLSTANATVTVEDNIAPAVLTQDITIGLDVNGLASISANDIDNGSKDACGIASLVLDVTDFDCSNIGQNTVTLTATDVNGNISSANAIVTVEDNIAPAVLTQDITIELDDNGSASISADDIDNGSKDACGITSLVLDATDFDCSNVGENTVTLTATDANGNVSSANATVTVEDNITPTVLTQDITIELNVNGSASISANDIDNGSKDACGIASLVLDVTDFDCSNVGKNTVTLTATDVNGNVSTANATVTVEDNIAPVVLTQDITVELDENGFAEITAMDVDAGSTDACGIATLNVSPALFSCTEIGPNTVMLVATDVNGNIATAEATVTVKDVTAPAVLTQNTVVFLDETGNASITVGDIDAGSFDNCGIESLTLDNTVFSCTDLGIAEVTLTATDASGNVASATAEVEVIDNIAPIIIDGPADIAIISTPDDCDPHVFWDMPSVEEACEYDFTVSHNSGDEFPLGTSVVTFTATDKSGNESVHYLNIYVEAQPLVAEFSAISEYEGGFNISCSGSADGFATVSVDGGCLPYTFGWSNGQTTQTATDLTAGDYTVTVTAANGAEITLPVTLTEPELLTASLTSPTVIAGFNSSCDVDGDGSAVLSTEGGVAPYAILWNTGDADVPSINGLNAGDYSVTVTDANGCVTETEITLTEPEACNCYPAVPAPPVTCAQSTMVIDGMNWVNIGSDDIACISSEYNSGVNLNKGTLIINGTASIYNLNLDAGDSVIVLGTLNVGGININSPEAVFENYGTVNINGWSNLNGTITNYGEMTVNQGMNINQNGALVNNGTASIVASFNLNGSIVNNGYISILGTVYANSFADLVNNCTFDIGEITINTTRTFENNGTFTAEKSLVLNNTLSYFGAGSITSLANFTENNASLNNTGAECNLISVKNYSMLNSGTANGPIAICDENGIEADNGINLVNGAAFSCDECGYEPTLKVKSYAEATVTEYKDANIEEETVFDIFPLPVKASDEFTVKYGSEEFTVEVYNLLGTLLYSEKATEETSIPATLFGSGSYIVKVISVNGDTAEEIIIIE